MFSPWVRKLVLGLVGLGCLTSALAFAQGKKDAEKPWVGSFGDGRMLTRGQLDLILKEHAVWLESHEREGKKADLGKAYLYRVNLEKVNLEKANLIGAKLRVANLIGAELHEANLSMADFFQANLSGANLSGANLFRANLSMAELSQANLSGAYLLWVNLRMAGLVDTDMTGAYFGEADLSGAFFEPKPGSVSDGSKFAAAVGLPSLTYQFSPQGLRELREAFKKAGMRDEERQVTYALNHTRRVKLLEKKIPKVGFFDKLEVVFGYLESRFNQVAFEWTCQYGMSPGRPLKILGLGLLVFAFPYMLALRSRCRETGIWVLLMSDRVLGRGGKDRPVKLTARTPFRPLPAGRGARLKARFWRGWRILRLGLYFSLLSAFQLGWRELNVGNWITRLQKREYTLRATGWVRTVGGFQSLLSVYLLALWVLTYFGRPFD